MQVYLKGRSCPSPVFILCLKPITKTRGFRENADHCNKLSIHFLIKNDGCFKNKKFTVKVDCGAVGDHWIGLYWSTIQFCDEYDSQASVFVVG
jgi:hypothetical protein